MTANEIRSCWASGPHAIDEWGGRDEGCLRKAGKVQFWTIESLRALTAGALQGMADA